MAQDPADQVVVITDSELPLTGEDDSLLASAGLVVRRENCRTAADVIAVGGDATALIVQWAPVTAEVLDALPHCRFISRLGIGCDMIDVDAATRRGVAVANNPDYCVEEVAAHTLALVLALVRQLPTLDRAVRAGRWSVTADAPRAGRPSTMTLAVVGFGRIGARVAHLGAGLGFRVVVHDPFVAEHAIRVAGHEAASLPEALATADVLSLHVPLTPATRHLIDGPALATMPPTSYLVNTCRGGLVDEIALADALQQGRLAGAALDVFEIEPLAEDSRLRDADDVLLSPHAAWYSPQSLRDLPVRAAEHVVAFLEGRPVASIVNPGYLDAHGRSGPVSS